MAGRSSEELERTLYVANLDDRVTDELLYELMMQAGPVEHVSRPKDRPFAFVIFEDEETVPYSICLLRRCKLFGRPLDMRPRDNTEQSRKIHQYMDDFYRKVRESNPSGGDRRSTSGDRDSGGGRSDYYHRSSSNERQQYDRYSSASYGGSGPADFAAQSRSVSWPSRDSALMPPPMPPMLPPPPLPPPGMDAVGGYPSIGGGGGDHHYRSAIRDFSSSRRRSDDHRSRGEQWDEDDQGNGYRSSRSSGGGSGDYGGYSRRSGEDYSRSRSGSRR